VFPNLAVADITAAKPFYVDYLGLTSEEFNLGWVARYSSPDGKAIVQLVTRDATAPEDSVLSVAVGSRIDRAYEEAACRGYEVVHPLTDEPWGPRRFFVRAPDGNIINITSHSDD
jgi:predicted enzyme related to lactoylglutathione lyase